MHWSYYPKNQVCALLCFPMVSFYLPLILSLVSQVCDTGCGAHDSVKYYKLSIYGSGIWYNSAHSTTITMIKFLSDFHSWMTPHTLWASYGVSFMSYRNENDHDISGAHSNSEWTLKNKGK